MKKAVCAILVSLLFLVGVLVSGSTSALTYQDEVDVKFTFNSTLSLSLSDNALIINNLLPGNSGVSNTINITINTNSLYGYILSASVGDTSNDYRDLKQENSNTSFSSIDVDSDMATITGTGSLWGFSKSLNGTTWSNYSGLPKYDDTENVAELKNTEGAAANDTIGFRIGAKAAEGQLAGDYANVINFIAVAKATPLYMQNVTSANCPKNPTIAYDLRDGKAYYIQKMTYGSTTKCWMIANLDLAGGTKLYSDDSNVPDGYPRSGGAPYYTLPASSMSGFDTNNVANVYNSGSTNCGKDRSCYSYYSYVAATVGTNPGSGNATYDICPKGWRISTKAEYEALTSVYSTVASLLAAPWSGVYSGSVWHSNFGNGGVSGQYWTSSAKNAEVAYEVIINKDSGVVIGISEKRGGYAVRCVAK